MTTLTSGIRYACLTAQQRIELALKRADESGITPERAEYIILQKAVGAVGNRADLMSRLDVLAAEMRRQAHQPHNLFSSDD